MVRKLLVPVVAVAALLVPVGGAAAHVAKAHATTVNVTAGKPAEFRFSLSKSSVPKGTVTFKISNKGKLPHDFKIANKKAPLLQPGKSGTLTVTFKKAGKYPYVCTVPGHAAAGMKGTLTVK